MDKKRIKLVSEWKAIDKLLGVNPKKLSENVRRKYFALKSLLIKESNYFKSSLGVPDYNSEILTENIRINTKDLVELAESKLVELCKKKKNVAKKISEISVEGNDEKKLEFKLESLVLGDVFDYLSENKVKELTDLGLMISKQLIEGYIKSLVAIVK